MKHFATFVLAVTTLTAPPSQVLAQLIADPTLADSLLLGSACAAYATATSLNGSLRCDPTSWFMQRLTKEVADCTAVVKQPSCQALVTKEPILRDSLRRCEISAICSDRFNGLATLKSCGDGFLIGTGEGVDAIKELTESSVDSLAALFQSLSDVDTNQSKDHAAVERKRQLLQEITARWLELKRKQGLSENEANALRNQMSAAAIESQVRDREYVDSLIERNSIQPLSLIQRAEQAERREREALKDTVRRARSVDESIELRLFRFAADSIEKEGVQLSCLDRRTGLMLKCWTAAYFVDPVATAGLIAKSGRIAEFMRKTLQHPKSPVRRAGESPLAAFENRRVLKTEILKADELFGQRTESTAIRGLPSSMNVARYRKPGQPSVLVFEKSVRLPDGSVKLSQRELPIDKLTGTIDGNFEAGIDFIETYVRESNGKVAIATIDVDALSFVSKNFTHGKVGSPDDLRRLAYSNGDKYLKTTAEILSKAVADIGHVVRTGGDEFVLLINSTDPAFVQQTLQKLTEQVRTDPRVRSVFTAESRARAEQFRAITRVEGEISPERAAAYRLDYAPFSQPNISVGSSIVNGESVVDAIAASDLQLARQKVATKTEFGADTTKYGGSRPEPETRPNLTYLAPVSPPMIGRAKDQTRVSVATEKSTGILELRPQIERFRFGDMAIVEHRDELKQPRLILERQVRTPDGRSTPRHDELFVNTRTGLIDARHERGRQVLEAFVKSQRTPERGAVWINLENLGLLNYGPNGTANGNSALAAVSNSLKAVIRSDNLPVKLEGSEFFVAVENVSPSEIHAISSRLKEVMARDSTLSKLYEAQIQRLRLERDHLRTGSAVSESGTATDLERDLETRLTKLETARTTPVSVYETPIGPADNLETVLQRTRGLRYPAPQ